MRLLLLATTKEGDSMIRLATEQVVALGRANKYLPCRRGGKPPHPSTLIRWAKDGVRADDGTLVHLETIRVGLTLCTSVESIQRFCERLTAPPAPAIPPRSAVERNRSD